VTAYLAGDDVRCAECAPNGASEVEPAGYCGICGVSLSRLAIEELLNADDGRDEPMDADWSRP
jgi:hypothetical protein